MFIFYHSLLDLWHRSDHSPKKLLVVSLVHSTLASSVSQYIDPEAEVWHICSKHLWCLECLIMLNGSKWPLLSQSFFLSPNVTASLDLFRQTTPTLGDFHLKLCWPPHSYLAVLLKWYPVKFSISLFIFSSHCSLLSIQKLRGASKPCPDNEASMGLCEGEIQVNPSVALPPSSAWHTHRPLCSYNTFLWLNCALHLEEARLYFPLISLET